MSMSFGLKFEVPWEIGPKKQGLGTWRLQWVSFSIVVCRPGLRFPSFGT